jgi:DNA-binding NtrC family response regulator
VLLNGAAEIGPEALRAPDGSRLDEMIALGEHGPATRAAVTAETVTRNLVGQTVAQVERDLILETLGHCLGNRTHAANILGISIRTLRNKLRQYNAEGIAVPEPGEPRRIAS